MNLTKDNYFSVEANAEYMSVSQFKAFRECEAKAIAEINGDYERPETDSLLMGSYIDAYFSGEMEMFTASNPQIFNSRTGALKANYVKAEEAIKRIESDQMFMKFLDGDKQVIFTGELFGIDWKAKIDVLHDDKIVDMKYMRDMKPIYKDGEQQTFIKAWGYDLQGYAYQQLVKMNTGKELPFYLAIVTKETPADIAIIHIPQFYLNSAGELIKHYAPIYKEIKDGKRTPNRCGHCDYCRGTKKLSSVTEYDELLEL